MNDTMVTLTGWLGSDVTLREAGDSTLAQFRVASTPRRYSRRKEEWVDQDTQWYTVNAWRQLGENCGESLQSGDPVVVHGRLNAHTFTNSAGMSVTAFDVEATFVGHDLAKGTTEFHRTPRADADGEASTGQQGDQQGVAASVA